MLHFHVRHRVPAFNARRPTQPATLVGTLTPWRDVNQTLAPPNLTTYGPSSPVEEEDRDSLSAYERDEEHQQLYDPPHQQPQHPHPHQLQGWSSDDLAPYQDDTAGINGQAKIGLFIAFTRARLFCKT